MNKPVFAIGDGAEPQPIGADIMTQPGDAPILDEISFDLRAIWSTIYRNRYIIIGIMLVALVAGVVVTMLMTPRYRAEATIQIEQQSAKVLRSDDTDLAEARDEDRFLQTQLDILQSRAIRQLVADKLNLGRNDNFFLRMHARAPIIGPGVQNAAAIRREAAIGILGRGITVTLPRNSRVAQIAFTSPDPVLAAQVSNQIVDTFILFNLQRKFDTSAYARNFVETRLAEVKRRLEESERALIDYARNASLIDASAGATSSTTEGAQSGPRSLTTSNLVQLNEAYSTATTQRVAAEQRWREAQRTPVMSLPEVLANATVQGLIQRRAEAQAIYSQDLQRRKPEFPSMLQQAALIKEIDRQISTASQNILNSYRNQYETALQQENALSSRLGDLKRDTLAEQTRSVRYTILKREADTNRALYDGLLQRYKELSASAGLLTNNISVLDPASVPAGPVSPKLLLNLLIAALAGAVVAGIIVLLREQIEDVIRLPDDVARKLKVTFLNSVPLVPAGGRPLEVLEDVRSPLSEAYYALRTSIELASSQGAPKLILFTSSRQGEGKSTSAVAIARNFARTGKRVLLIDGDLRKPSLHRILDMPRTDGFSSLLARHRAAEDIVVHTDEPNLDFIGCGPLPPNPAELLSGPTLNMALRDFSARYDHVIIDGPPVLGLADAVLLGSRTDAVIFVIQFNSSRSVEAKAAIARLRTGGAKLLGVVLTKFDARKAGYGEGYGYKYAYTYGAAPTPNA